MDSRGICSLIFIIVTLFGFTFNNLFLLFIVFVMQPFYYSIFSKELSFFFYYFLSIIIWFSIIVFIVNLSTEKNTLSPNASFKEKLINFFIREDVKKVYLSLKDRKIKYSVLLSVMGGFIGIFSLGNLYNRLYKRFIVEFIIGLVITISVMISIYNYPLSSDIMDILYFIMQYPFSVIYPLYYVFIINDCYECALSIKNNSKLPSILKMDLLIYITLILLGFVLTKNIPSIMIFGHSIKTYGDFAFNICLLLCLFVAIESKLINEKK